MNVPTRAVRSRSSVWRLRSKSLVFGPLPAIMGIVNVTPDSFSDGGSYFAAQQAIDHALRLEDAGADLLDIGGESTRPYSAPVTEVEELRRIEPVISGLANRVHCPISIDTSKSRVAAAAIALGAECINDVTGLEGEPEMLGLAARSGVGVCAMHMQGRPPTMQDAPAYRDVVQEIYQYLSDRQSALLAGGIAPERICLDPGIGFGKTHAHNLELIRSCAQFLELGSPILVGHSRKGFIGQLIGDKQLPRDAGTLGISIALARQGIQLLRVHDVAMTRQALQCYAAAGGLDHPEPKQV